MKKLLSFLLFSVITISASAADGDSTVHYALPDSVKAIAFLAEIKVQSVSGNKESFAGIQTDLVKLSLEAGKQKEVVFQYPQEATVVATGMGVTTSEKGELGWNYDWQVNEAYKLFIAIASDSADNFVLYSGYIFLPKENKWKLLGTCRISGQWGTIRQPSFYYTSGKKSSISATVGQVWCQRHTGFWKNMLNDDSKIPTLSLTAHVDSVQQYQADKQQIEAAIAAGRTDVKENVEGVYYKMMTEGTGAAVSVNDNVVINYKGYLLSDGTIFDQTKDKPATFPLKRLIKGWQIGVPLCKVGGKIKLVIPSALAYSIRTRAAKIPPNSILVFEIEVLEVKSGN